MDFAILTTPESDLPWWLMAIIAVVGVIVGGMVYRGTRRAVHGKRMRDYRRGGEM